MSKLGEKLGLPTKVLDVDVSGGRPETYKDAFDKYNSNSGSKLKAILKKIEKDKDDLEKLRDFESKVKSGKDKTYCLRDFLEILKKNSSLAAGFRSLTGSKDSADFTFDRNDTNTERLLEKIFYTQTKMISYHKMLSEQIREYKVEIVEFKKEITEREILVKKSVTHSFESSIKIRDKLHILLGENEAFEYKSYHYEQSSSEQIFEFHHENQIFISS